VVNEYSISSPRDDLSDAVILPLSKEISEHRTLDFVPSGVGI
jgi:hypothetical protein